MSARADILGRLRPALDAGASLEARRAAAAARLTAPPRVAPMGRVSGVDLVATFQMRAEEIGATVTRVTKVAEIGGAVADYARGRNLPSAVRLSPKLASWTIDWPATVSVTSGGTEGDDLVGVAPALAGVAETGTLVLGSGADSPTKLNFLPETHIVVLPASKIVGGYEEAWDQVRRDLGGPLLPRVVNWISGPSRTADIEQTLLVGVHGPKRIHIVIVEEDFVVR